MKRVGNLYSQIYDIDNLRLAHKNARRGKTWYKEVQMVDSDPDYYLGKLQESLINQTYYTSEYEIFTKNDTGKQREIYKLPYYPDRICQWAIIQVIEKYLIKHFTDDTYSAIPRKGIHYGVRKIKKQIKEDDSIFGLYCLKFDISKYYPSINQGILKQQYRRLFKDKQLLWLLDEIIDSVENGVPIGNYLSQYSGNLYLSWFDHWIKEEKHVKYYHRYMDDVVILDYDPSKLHTLFREIETYLRNNLKLTIKYNYQIFPIDSRGVDFLGYRFFKGYTLLRKRTVKAIKKKCKKGMNEQSRQSYIGWLKHCDGYRFTQKYLRGEINDSIQRRTQHNNACCDRGPRNQSVCLQRHCGE